MHAPWNHSEKYTLHSSAHCSSLCSTEIHEFPAHPEHQRFSHSERTDEQVILLDIGGDVANATPNGHAIHLDATFKDVVIQVAVCQNIHQSGLACTTVTKSHPSQILHKYVQPFLNKYMKTLSLSPPYSLSKSEDRGV